MGAVDIPGGEEFSRPKSDDELIGEVLSSLVDISETLMHCLAKQARKMQDDPDFPEASMMIKPDMSLADARAEVNKIKEAMG